MMPIGSKAFVPAILKNTNEIFVALNADDDKVVVRTHPMRAKDIANRRIDEINKDCKELEDAVEELEDLKKEITKNLRFREASFADSLLKNNLPEDEDEEAEVISHNERMVDIREQYDERIHHSPKPTAAIHGKTTEVYNVDEGGVVEIIEEEIGETVKTISVQSYPPYPARTSSGLDNISQFDYKMEVLCNHSFMIPLFLLYLPQLFPHLCSVCVN
jgi:hypothetical protein